MKKIHLYTAVAALLLLAGACSEEQFDATGEGKVKLSTSLSTDMSVVSRATDAELAESCLIWISSEKGLVRKYQGVSSIPTDGINLVTGHYVAEAWAGDSVSASFDTRCFYGRETFDVAAGQTSAVALSCKIANVAASVRYAEGIEDVLSDFTMTVGHERGSLIFEGRDERRGYFMMPSTDKNLTYELKGKQLDGSDFYFKGTIENAQRATEYVLNVTYTPPTNTMGGAVFTIEIDDHVIAVESDIQLIAAPRFTGYGFDIASPVIGEPGGIGARTVYVASAAQISKIELHSDYLSNVPVLGGTDVDLLNMSQEGADALAAAGISVRCDYNAEKDETLAKITFDETMTNALTVGDYVFDMTATDAAGRANSATLTIKVSSAPVMTEAPLAEAVKEHSAELRGRVSKEGVNTVGFNYRAKGAADWTYVEGTVASRAYAAGTEFTATVTGLKGNTTYEYVAVSDDFVSAVAQEFTTGNDQLPNSSFEEWFMYKDKIGIPGSKYPDFWDTGNHGSATLNKLVTTQSSDFVHSGSYSLCLKSQFVGLFGAGKFAAGNVFAGRYLNTNGTDGELGWGQPWTLRPRQVKVWAKYVPGTVQSGKNKGSGEHMAVGALDQGMIYVALVDGTRTVYKTDATSKTDAEGTEWPCVVKTKSKEFFDKAGANVVAYGEHVFETATAGDGLVEITIDLNDVHGNLEVQNIIFVASASRYGDYFEGGEGSLLYLDDIELVY